MAAARAFQQSAIRPYRKSLSVFAKSIGFADSEERGRGVKKEIWAQRF